MTGTNGPGNILENWSLRFAKTPTLQIKFILWNKSKKNYIHLYLTNFPKYSEIIFPLLLKIFVLVLKKSAVSPALLFGVDFHFHEYFFHWNRFATIQIVYHKPRWSPWCNALIATNKSTNKVISSLIFASISPKQPLLPSKGKLPSDRTTRIRGLKMMPSQHIPCKFLINPLRIKALCFKSALLHKYV